MSRERIKDEKGNSTNFFWSTTDGDSRPDTEQTVYSDSHRLGVGVKEEEGLTYNPTTGKLGKRD